MSQPSVFVGSSSEGIEFARAIRAQLQENAEVTLWNEGFFSPGSTFIETLINSLSRFDFAVIVLTPDDLIKSRNDEKLGPRDNIIFELGLFMGRLGRSRTFIVHQAKSDAKIPTDLSGVTMAQYFWPRHDDNYEAAVGAACDAIRKAIRDLGMSPERLNQQIGQVTQRQDYLESEISEVKETQATNNESIHELQEFKRNVLEKLIAFSMSGFIYGHLQRVYYHKRGKKPLVYNHIDQIVKRELQFLKDNGYIEHLEIDELKTGDDLAQKVVLTPAGQWFVELREAMEGKPIPNEPQSSSS